MRVPWPWAATSVILSALLAEIASPALLRGRQTWTGIWAHDFTLLGCRPVIMIFARETIGPGNMGDKVGPQLSNGLKLIFGASNVAAEGVDYPALPDTNYLPIGSPPEANTAMRDLLTAATSRCPSSFVVAAGYSQGAAVAHGALFGMADDTKKRIAGVVTFGDTRALQNGMQISGFPKNRTFIICNNGDVICNGTLFVLPVHLNYTGRVPEAVAFLMFRIISGDSLKQIAVKMGMEVAAAGLGPGLGPWPT